MEVTAEARSVAEMLVPRGIAWVRRSELLDLFGVSRLARSMTRHVPRVLMYHRFGVNGERRRMDLELFEQQLIHLKRHFVPMTVSQLVQHIGSGRKPEMAVSLTVDDCYADFYTHAWPLLKKYQVPATIYAVTRFVSNEVWLWPDRVRFIVYASNSEVKEIRFSGAVLSFDLRGEKEREDAWERFANFCLTLTNDQRVSFIAHLAQVLRVDPPAAPTEEFAPMNWRQLSEVSAGGIEVGSHTLTHPRLTSLPMSEVRREMVESKAEIERNLGVKVRSFCYPNGTSSDYNDEIKQCARECGYDNAVVACDVNPPLQDVFEIGRTGVPDDLSDFRVTVSGLSAIVRLTGKRRVARASVGNGAN